MRNQTLGFFGPVPGREPNCSSNNATGCDNPDVLVVFGWFAAIGGMIVLPILLCCLVKLVYSVCSTKCAIGTLPDQVPFVGAVNGELVNPLPTGYLNTAEPATQPAGYGGVDDVRVIRITPEGDAPNQNASSQL